MSGPIFVSRSMPGPQRDAAGAFDHRLDELRVDRPLDQDPAAGRTHLTLIDEHPEQRAVDRRFEISVGEEDVG